MSASELVDVELPPTAADEANEADEASDVALESPARAAKLTDPCLVLQTSNRWAQFADVMHLDNKIEAKVWAVD